MATVTLTNVANTVPSRKPDEVAQLSGVSFAVGDGEFAALVGPRRSGKSELLRVIAGLDQIASGEISIGDRQVNEVAPKDRDVAMVFRDYALYPHMTADENIGFGLKMRKFPKNEIQKRVQEAAAILEIADLLQRKPDALSIEQRLRVAIARTVVRQPKVFLFDDPLANLDAARRPQLRVELAKLHQRLAATMIYATSDPLEAMSLSDRIVVLNAGSVQQSERPTAIYDAPANTFVAGFMGDPAMNLIEGTLKRDRETLLFRESGDGTIEVRLPVAEHAGAVEFAGKPIVLGIRPEDITVAALAGAQKSENSFPALLEVVEPMGAATKLYLQTGAHTFICVSQNPVERSEAGRRLRCTMNPERTHFFDPASTRRIDPA